MLGVECWALVGLLLSLRRHVNVSEEKTVGAESRIFLSCSHYEAARKEQREACVMKIPGLDRITFDPHVMHGQACIRGMQVTVSLVVNLVASGMTKEEIVKAYAYVELHRLCATLHG